MWKAVLVACGMSAVSLVSAVQAPQRDPHAGERGAQAEAQTDPKIAALIVALGGPSWPKAIDELAALGDPRAVEPLAGALHDRPWWIRAAAASALGRVRSKAGIGPLVAALGDKDGQVRQAVREALAAHGETAVAAIAAALDAPDEAVRWQAAWVLAHIDAPSVADPLLRALERDDAAVRQESAAALARIGSDTHVDRLARLLRSPDPSVREEAAWVLGELGSPRGVAPLVTALGDPDTGWMAAAALGVLNAISARSLLAGALASASTRTRRAAAWSLNRLAAAETIPELRRALDDTDPEVRYWAAEALRRIGTPEAARAVAAAPLTAWDREAHRCAPERSSATIAAAAVTYRGRTYRLYPETLEVSPDIPSPLAATDGTELVVALTWDGRHGIYPVTLKALERQCDADGDDFPTLARTGLHAEVELDRTHTITGRSVGDITELGRPGRLSVDGFLGAGEEIVSVLRADNRIVAALGLTHPELARPLLHIWNMMRTDLDLNRWNMAEHRWRNVTTVLSHGRAVRVVAGDTKGVQLSIFADRIEGYFWIEIDRDLTEGERALLATRYGHLEPRQMDALVRALTHIKTGEIEPHYVMWYGFYEGHTEWRTDPITIALVFGLRTLEEIEAAFPGRLYEVMIPRRPT